VTITDFLLAGGRDLQLAFFHHGTQASDEAESFVSNFARDRRLSLRVGRIQRAETPRGLSQEEHWREERYSFLHSIEGPVVTCHHLDDAVETWIFTSLHGVPRLIPSTRGNVVRPFLVTPKSDILSWASRRGLTWAEDPSNADTKHSRNLIRHVIVPQALKVNPGLRKVIKKKYLAGADAGVSSIRRAAHTAHF